MGVPIGPPRKAATGAAPEKDSGHLCYWEVTRVRLKDEGRHGKAWGRLVWRGESLSCLILAASLSLAFYLEYTLAVGSESWRRLRHFSSSLD